MKMQGALVPVLPPGVAEASKEEITRFVLRGTDFELDVASVSSEWTSESELGGDVGQAPEPNGGTGEKRRRKIRTWRVRRRLTNQGLSDSDSSGSSSSSSAGSSTTTSGSSSDGDGEAGNFKRQRLQVLKEWKAAQAFPPQRPAVGVAPAPPDGPPPELAPQLAGAAAATNVAGQLRPETRSPPKAQAAVAGRFCITVDKKEGMALGVDLGLIPGGDSLLITEIKPGVVEDWNRQHPDRSVAKDDHVIAVNGVSGDGQKMLAECRKAQSLTLQIRKASEALASLEWFPAAKAYRNFAVARGFLSMEDIQAIHSAAHHPSVTEINDRKGYLAFKHRVWRFEAQLRILYPSLYTRLFEIMARADVEKWKRLYKNSRKKKRVYPEIEYIVYDVAEMGEPCFIEPHVDNKSAVTLVALLSDPRDFVGGGNCFRRAEGKEGSRQVLLQQGDAAVFRGEKLLHWITPVTEGRRVILQIELSRV